MEMMKKLCCMALLMLLAAVGYVIVTKHCASANVKIQSFNDINKTLNKIEKEACKDDCDKNHSGDDDAIAKCKKNCNQNKEQDGKTENPGAARPIGSWENPDGTYSSF